MLEGLVQRQFDAAQNRLDVAAIVAMWDDDAIFEFPGDTPMSGTIEGRAAIEAWWRRWVERYASVRFTVKQVGIVSLRPGAHVVMVAWDFDGTTRDEIRLQTSGVSLVKTRRGKIAHAKDFIFDPSSLESVWGRSGEHEHPNEVPQHMPATALG